MQLFHSRGSGGRKGAAFRPLPRVGQESPCRKEFMRDTHQKVTAVPALQVVLGLGEAVMLVWGALLPVV